MRAIICLKIYNYPLTTGQLQETKINDKGQCVRKKDMNNSTRKGNLIRQITEWMVKKNELWFLRGRGCNVIWDTRMQKFISAGAAQSKQRNQRRTNHSGVRFSSKSLRPHLEILNISKRNNVQWKICTISRWQIWLNRIMWFYWSLGCTLKHLNSSWRTWSPGCVHSNLNCAFLRVN